jgi:lysophospholipase L1-like esterase
MKIVCIGNSNVNGFPHPRSRCWVSLFREMTGHSVINKGINGDSTDGVIQRFASDVSAHRPGIVVVLSGTNDFILLGRGPQEVMENYRKMAELAMGQGIKPVFLIPPLTEPEQAGRAWLDGTDYHACNRQLAELRSMMLEYGEAEAGKVQVIDLQAAYTGGFVDGIHLTEEGHAQTAQLLATALAPVE